MYGARFPYIEKSLDGVFGCGIRKLKLNIRYEANLSSQYSNGAYPVSNCFDGNSGSFCHTLANDGEYIQVHFLDSKFKIEGFAVQNRHDGCHNPLNYMIRGSNDGSNFHNISLFEEEKSEVCANGLIRTNRVNTSHKYSYFRLQMTGLSCYGTQPWLNLAEFDLFGSFREMCLLSYKRNNTFFSHIISFAFMIAYS